MWDWIIKFLTAPIRFLRPDYRLIERYEKLLADAEHRANARIDEIEKYWIHRLAVERKYWAEKNVECEQNLAHERSARLKLNREVFDLRRLVVELERERLHGTVVIDRLGMIIEANAAIAALCDCGIEDMLGTPLLRWIPPRYRERHSKAIQEVMNGARPLRLADLEGDILTINLQERPVTIRLSAMGSGDDLKFVGEIFWR